MRRILTFVCATFLLGCRQILALDSYGEGKFSDSGGLDTSFADRSFPDALGRCILAKPPPRTIIGEAAGAVELTFVSRTVDVGDVPGSDGIPGYRKVGYDIDDRCAGDPPACSNSFRSVAREDGVGGIDNALGEMIATIKAQFGQEIITSSLVNDRVKAGELAPTFIFRIRGYDGLQDDNYVEVEWYFPVLTQAQDSGTDDAGPDAPRAKPPAWDGNDVWPIQSTSFVQPPSPGGAGGAVVSRTSVDGYVSHFRLVARFPEGIPMRFWRITGPLFEPVLSVDVVPNTATNQFELHKALLTGKVARRHIFSVIPIGASSLPGSTTLCMESPAYPFVRQWMCGLLDLGPAGADGAVSECDMLSVGMAFEPAPAKIGAIIEEPSPPELCPPETNPTRELCEVPDSSF